MSTTERRLRRTHASEDNRFRQARLALFAKLLFALAIASFALSFVVLWAVGDHKSFPMRGRDVALNASIVTLLGLLWAYCSRGERPRAAIDWLDAGSPIVLCTMLSWLLLGHDGRYRPEVGMILGLTHILIARAVFVPSTARHTVAIGASSSLPILVVTYLVYARADHPDIPSAFGSTLAAATTAALAVASSAVVSHVIYGLRIEMLKARQLGQYTLEEKIGEGGMGVVFRARHAFLRRPTAVKMLAPGRMSDSDIRRFEREVQATSQLTHPNTVAIFDYGRTPDGVFYYAMEYLNGTSLEDLVRLMGPQPSSRVVHILKQICGALSEAHDAGLVHRDIKPANVLICERGGVPDVAKVLDFGLVKTNHSGTDPNMTAADLIVGTPNYMSPEAISSPGLVDARSDVYAVGALAYFMICGEPVHRGRHTLDILQRHLSAEVVAPSLRLRKPIAPALEALILSCLRKMPELRPQSAGALREALETCEGVPRWSDADARAALTRQRERITAGAHTRARWQAERLQNIGSGLSTTVSFEDLSADVA